MSIYKKDADQDKKKTMIIMKNAMNASVALYQKNILQLLTARSIAVDVTQIPNQLLLRKHIAGSFSF